MTNRPEDFQKDHERILHYLANLKKFNGGAAMTDIRSDGDAGKEPFVLRMRNAK